ncbi:MAG TPA: GNAT family N-acetyltransferase [Jatrophihabitans sp.]|nr:GNAT family N-acetyltransferase [Jatrophihabitans sp.]
MLDEGLLGRRVVLRYERDDPAGRPPLSDLIGTLTGLTEDAVTIHTSGGLRTVRRAAVRAAKAVEANRRDVLELARIGRLGWRAATRTQLDGWLLDADLGWTGRANSALPLGQLDRPLDAGLVELRSYYEGRGLLAQIQLPLPARSALDAALAERGWTVQRPSLVLTRSLAAPWPTREMESASVAGSARTLACTLADRPDRDWLATYHYRGGQLPAGAVDLLTRHERVRFAAIRDGQQVLAIGRATVDEGWLGITAVEVAPTHRRRGLAGDMMRALLDWGRSQAGAACYLQVDGANTAALALYRGLGFTVHHRYHYRVPPA